MSHADRGERWWSDLALVASLALLAGVCLLVPGVPRPLEWALGIPLLVVAPGWALVSAALPQAPRADDGDVTRDAGWPVRIALALLGSVLLVALLALAASATVGITLVPVVLAVVAVTLGLSFLAVVRRQAVPAHRRASPIAARDGLPGPRVARSSAQTVVFILALALLASAVAFAGTNPIEPDGYTEFYVLTEGDDGTLTAAGFPQEFPAGEGHDLHVAIENEEGRPTSYAVVVRSQPNGSADGQVIDRFETQVADGERVIAERTIAPTTASERTRLQFLLFEGGAPANPTADEAESALSIWVEVTEGTGA